MHRKHGVGLLPDAAILCCVHWNIETNPYEVGQCLCKCSGRTFVVAVTFVRFRFLKSTTAVRITMVAFYIWPVVSFISTAFSAATHPPL